MNFTDTITIYNIIPQRGREPERLQRTVLGGVFWDGTYGAGFDKRGKEEQDSVMVMIPFMPQYEPPERWLAAGAPADRFTLRPGDIILRGVGGDFGSAAEIKRQYGSESAIIITRARDCCYGSRHMWHWEVTGK